MKSRGRIGQVPFLILLFALLAARGYAVLFKSTGDPSYNTNAPTGSLTNSGWQYEGQWNTEYGPFLGTPIAPRFFLAAYHVGGSSGQPFVFNGFTYTTVTNFDDPTTDLRVWQVAETFPAYAPLYTAADETNKSCVVFGRGKQRGPAVIVSGATNGWAWGAADFVERWGQNTIQSVYTDPTYGDHLVAYFDRNGGSNECMLTVYDSSGAMFIEDGTTWKLAGIHHAIRGSFVSTNGVTGSGFDAALLDYGGVYIGGDGNWMLVTNQPADNPAYFLSTRVSVRVAWINSIINFDTGPDLRFTGIQQVGMNVQVSLSTGSNRLYRVDSTSDLDSGVWTTVTNNVSGTGGIVTIIDLGVGSQTQRFYRATIVQ